MDLINIKLPLDNPVIVFGIVLLIILLAPLALKRFRIPSIVGLIISGMIVGPNGFNILNRDSSTDLFGTVGLLFIMFIAGLEIDFHQFSRNKKFSIFYAFLFFFLPFSFGFLITYYILNFSILTSTMLSLVFSTNTLVSYPIIKRLSISNHFAVISAVSAAMIADTTILIALGFFKDIAISGFSFLSSILLISKFIFYIIIILYSYPFITKYFFKKIELDNVNQFIFILTLLFFSATLSYILDIEPIIGAFLTGLALNKLIPNQSVLMGRIEFVGNTIFIPFFLVFVGFLIDVKTLYSDIDTWFYSIIFVSISFLSKYISIYISSKLFNIDNNTRGLIYGLNLSQAGATVAIALVIFNLGILPLAEFNAIIILVLISCIVSSFITERYGRLIAISSTQEIQSKPLKYQKILVPFANPKTVESLLDLALAIKIDNNEPIYPLSVIIDQNNSESFILKNNEYLKNVKLLAESVKVRLQLVFRVDTSITDGIARAIKELVANCVIIGWNFKSNAFGSIKNKQLEQLLNLSNTMMLVTRLSHPINLTDNIYIFLPEYSELEIGCSAWLNLVYQLSRHIGADVTFIGFIQSLDKIKLTIKNSNFKFKTFFREIEAYNDLVAMPKEFLTTDLLIVINSRPKGISYNSTYSIAFNRSFRNISDNNIIVLFPEQSSVFNSDVINSNSDVLDASLIEENISIIYRIKTLLKSKLK